ncbi:MAG: cobalamin-dependent protein, partial [Clostridia bacterium]|nr:cobalamin-dependent protein [Clostridia bacterium]
IIFDPLTLTVGTDSDAACVTLESVRIISEKTGCNTVLGVSNVSFGLPGRSIINSAFFILAMQSGLSSAIINPLSPEMMGAYRSYLALKGIDKSCLGYISYVKAREGEKKADTVRAQADDTLEKAVIEGRKEAAALLTKELLKDIAPLDIISGMIIPSLDTVGKNFESKKAFLPELLLSAEAAKASFEVIKENYSTGAAAGKFTVILATVKGDIHDIGKNIVKLLLENYGYKVIDLGKDVPSEEVLKAAKENSARVVGLSALMTTTLPSMEETVALIRKELPGCVVVVGGAVLTAEYAEKIHADAYCSDAMETVRYLEEIK